MKINILLVLFFQFFLSFSQKVHIKGEIKFEKVNSGHLAEIILANRDSIVGKVIVKEEGRFCFDHLSLGNYNLIIKESEEVLYAQSLELKEDTDLGILSIRTPNELQEILVTGKKRLIDKKVDRTIYNIENSIGSAGTDVLDILHLMPGIEVRNNQLFLTGKSSVKVMIDDKILYLNGDDLFNYLKSIPSDQVKNIEVITTPPSQYDAEGNSGLININLKKIKKDFWASNLTSSYKQGYYASGNFGANFTYSKNKINLGLSSNYSNGNYKNLKKSKVYYPEQLWDEKETGKNYQNILSSKFLLDYQLTSKWNSGIQYLLNYSEPHSRYKDITNFHTYENKLDSLLRTKSYENSTKRLNSLNWYSHFTIDSLGKKIKLNFDYFNYNTEKKYNYLTRSYRTHNDLITRYFPVENKGSLDIDNYSGRVDIDYPLSFISLQYGAKISFTKTKSSLRNYLTKGENVIEKMHQDDFIYKENSQALYVSASKEMKKWDIQLGIRMENTQTRGNSISLNERNKNNYLKFFSTLYILYKANENNSYSFTYSRRIDRPDYNSVNPFRNYSNPYQYSEGNPFLKPVINNSIELSYYYKDIIQTILQFMIQKDNFNDVTYLDKDSYIQATKVENYFDNYGVGIIQSFTYTKLNWLQSNLMLVGGYLYLKSKIYPITDKSQEGFMGRIQANNTFILNKSKTLSADLIISYYPRSQGALSTNYSLTQMDMFFKAQLLDKKMQLSLQVTNLFNADQFRNKSTNNGISAKYRGYYESPSIRISLSYKLGSSTVKEKNIEGSNTEDQNRIK